MFFFVLYQHQVLAISHDANPYPVNLGIKLNLIIKYNFKERAKSLKRITSLAIANDSDGFTDT